MIQVPTNTSDDSSRNDDLSKRLASIQRAIHKAASEALETAQIELGPTDDDNEENDASLAKAFVLFGRDTVDVEREVRSKLIDMETELKQLVLTTDSNDPSHNDDDNDDPAWLETQAQKLTQQIAFLKECSLARSHVDEATTTYSHDWVESAKWIGKAQVSITKAQDLLSSGALSPNEAAAHEILESIRIPAKSKRVEYMDRAESIVRDSCTFTTPHSIQVQSPVDALDVLQALAPQAAPDAPLRHVAHELERLVFEPLLENHRNGTLTGSWIFRQDTRSEQEGQASIHVLNWTTRTSGDALLEDTQENQVTAWGDTLKLVQKVMSFVQEHVLLQRVELCEVVGLALFGGPESSQQREPLDDINLDAFGLTSHLIGSSNNGALVRSMLKLWWSKCIPSHCSNADQLAALPVMAEKLKGFCLSFEHDMAERYFFTHSRLSDFCIDFEQKYAEKRRIEILGDARDLLLTNDYHNTVEVGVDVAKSLDQEDDGLGIFKLHKCAVSTTAFKLHDMCRAAMEEAVDSPILAPHLYRTARELLDLFRALCGSDMERNPRTAAVFHNDCVFLAHHCLTLGLEYKEKFSSAQPMLQQSCVFVDMVPPFRELANRSMQDMIETQQTLICNMIGPRITLLGNALQSNESLAEWSDAETALVSGVNHLRHLSHQWKPVLSSEVYSGSVGHLVDTVFCLYMDRVLEATDISEAACHFVSGLFGNATRKMSTLVTSSRLWDRFAAIGQFMTMSIAQIESALANGVFRTVTGTELSKLIVATFDDSDKRKALLQALAVTE